MTLSPANYRKTEFTHRIGLSINKPAAADVLTGTLYFSSDTSILERSNGTIWESYSSISVSSLIQGPPGLDGINGEDGFSPIGVIQANQFPALTGDVTTVAGSLVTTISSNFPRLNAANVFSANAQTIAANTSALALKVLGRTTGSNASGVEFYSSDGVTLKGYFQVSDTYFILASAVGYCAINGNTYIEFDSGGVESMRLHASGGLTLGDTTDPGDNNFRLTGIINFAGTNTTGAGIAAFGTNSPAVTLTAPYTWLQIKTADGSTAYIPCWK